MEVDDGWRKGWSIEGGRRGKGVGDGFGGWAVERGLVGGIGKRHCGGFRCYIAIDAGFGMRSRRLTLTLTLTAAMGREDQSKGPYWVIRSHLLLTRHGFWLSKLLDSCCWSYWSRTEQ